MSCGKPCECSTYRDHLLSVSVAAAALPSRRGAVAATEAEERTLRKDIDAYRRFRRDGLEPTSYIGAAELEKRADERHQIETHLTPTA